MISSVKESDIESALGNWAPDAAAGEPGCWGFTLDSGHDLPARAEREGDWLCLSVKCPGKIQLAVSDPWRVAAANSDLSGVARLSLSAKRNPLCLRADLSLRDGDALQSRLQEAGKDLSLSIKRLCSPEKETCDVSPLTDREADDLKASVVESGWSLTERPDGSVMVDLATSDGYYQARVKCAEHDGLRVSTELGRFEHLSHLSKEAVAVLLLRVCSDVRMMRSYVKESDEELIVGLEAALPRRPSRHEVHFGLCALSVACRVCGRELPLLADTDLAGSYLAMTGWRP